MKHSFIMAGISLVWIKYPTLEIPGEPEMTENANAVIREAIKKIEDNTYKKTDKNIVVTADYKINYISGGRHLSGLFL